MRQLPYLAKILLQFTGVLKVSGNYINVEIDGADPATKQGSVVNPVDALGAKDYDGKKVTIIGYFNGLSGGGKYLNVIATKIEEAGAKGSLANPYTPLEACEAVKDLTWTSNTEYETTDDVYVAGKISKIANKARTGLCSSSPVTFCMERRSPFRILATG